MVNDKMVNNQLRLIDGTIVKRCPTDKPLYCSRDGRFFSVHNAVLTDDGWILRQLKPHWTRAMANHKRGSCYPSMRQFGLCHTIMALTWLGSRPMLEVKIEATGITIWVKAEIDHLNGNIFDYSADNLQYVTPFENRRRARILRDLRASGLTPCTLTRTQLLDLFNQAFLRCATAHNLAGDVYEGD